MDPGILSPLPRMGLCQSPDGFMAMPTQPWSTPGLGWCGLLTFTHVESKKASSVQNEKPSSPLVSTGGFKGSWSPNGRSCPWTSMEPRGQNPAPGLARDSNLQPCIHGV